MERFPTLTFIDRAVGGHQSALANDPAAADLERLARVLTAEYWSETVWLTGQVAGPALAVARQRLERERGRPQERAA